MSSFEKGGSPPFPPPPPPPLAPGSHTRVATKSWFPLPSFPHQGGHWKNGERRPHAIFFFFGGGGGGAGVEGVGLGCLMFFVVLCSNITALFCVPLFLSSVILFAVSFRDICLLAYLCLLLVTTLISLLLFLYVLWHDWLHGLCVGQDFSANAFLDPIVCVRVPFSDLYLQWNPREVNTLEVNSRLKSTPHGGPDFFLLCLSNFISLKVNILGPILG